MRARSRTVLTMLLLAAPLLLLLRSTASPAVEGDTAIVHATDAPAFEPAEVRIPQGGKVVWKNSSALVHTVTDDPRVANDPADAILPEGAQPWDSGELRPGQTYSRRFDVPGTYRYFCKPHENHRMVGTIVVE